MSPNIIFVAGVHGVGKTTYCYELSKKLGLQHFSASDIIRSQKASAVPLNTKSVKNTEKNQDLLLQGIEGLELFNKDIILDGHFVLLQNDEIKHLPLSTYEGLRINKIILLSDSPENIYKRITARDVDSQFSVDLINRMQIAETEYAKEVSQVLDVKLKVVTIIDKSSEPSR